MKPDNKTLLDMLRECRWGDLDHEEAEQAIKDLILSKLPEEDELDVPESMRDPETNGANYIIRKIIKIIKEEI